MGNWEAWFNSQNRVFNRGKEINLASTYVIAINAALQGAGIAMAHDTLATDLIEQQRLIKPFDHTPDLPEGYFLLPPSNHGDTPASRVFLQWLSAKAILN